MIKTAVASLILLFSLLLIETTILANIPYLPALPDLLLIAVMFLGLRNGVVAGETAGFFSGLMLDFVSASPPGLNCLVRTAAGAVCGVFSGTLNSSGLFPSLLFGVCITCIKAVLLKLCAFFFPNAHIIVYKIFSIQFGSELILNMIFAPVLFVFLSLFGVLSQERTQNENDRFLKPKKKAGKAR